VENGRSSFLRKEAPCLPVYVKAENFIKKVRGGWVFTLILGKNRNRFAEEEQRTPRQALEKGKGVEGSHVQNAERCRRGTLIPSVWSVGEGEN